MHSKFNFNGLSLLLIVMLLPVSTIVQAAEIKCIGSLGGKIWDSVACQDFVFLAQRNFIIILDAKDPQHMREISRYCVDADSVGRLAVKWPILFFKKEWIGGNYTEVSTLEIKDPAHPREIEVGEQLGGNDLATSGSLLLADMRSRIEVFDVSDPYHPKTIPSETIYEKWEWAEDMDTFRKLKPPLPISDDVLYHGSVHGVVADGRHVYLLDDASSLKAFDLTDLQKQLPIAPIANADKIKTRIVSAVKAFNNEDKTYQDRFKIICRKGEHLDNGEYGDQLTIQKITNGNAPKRLSSFAETPSGESIEKFGIIGDRLFVVYDASWKFKKYELSVYDIHKPEKPLLLGSLNLTLGKSPSNVAISGDRIYLADQDRGLIVFRFMKPIKSPQNP